MNIALHIDNVEQGEALEIVKTFFANDFEGGRHERRVEKIAIATAE